EALGDLLFDPQTSGGLLVAVGADGAAAAAARFTAAGVPAVRIGRVLARTETALVVR
ncbi:MAG: selenide, water dikinase SelD, partial [Acidobacteria bacterium]|nr:selenide, water dikinase SelD [Acidobacteriota bacterium]